MEDFSIKELYDVVLKTTYPIEVGNRKIETNETVAVFDKIQIANFQENKSRFTAHGGQGNHSLVFWEDTKEISLNFVQGVFSKTQMALMINASLIHNNGTSYVKINHREIVESNTDGEIFLKHNPIPPYFVYDQLTGEKAIPLVCENNILYMGVENRHKEYLVDYYYNYNNGYDVLSIGNPLTNSFLSLEGKTRVKDDITGQVKTGIIKIPKLRLLSNLSMRLGNDAIPQVGRIDAIAVPTGERGEKKVMEILFLNDDIDSDM